MSHPRSLPVTLGFVLVALAFTRAAPAVPVEWKVADGGNGHFYEAVGLQNTWEFARAAAASRSHLGVPGHLATITSAAEQSFLVASRINQFSDLYIGGFQAPDSPAPDQGWSWITGEPWDFTYWGTLPTSPNEPTDGVGLGSPEDNQENYLSMYSSLSRGGRWNDVNGTLLPTNVSGYLVEYPVPEPSAAALLLALPGAMLRRRRGR